MMNMTQYLVPVLATGLLSLSAANVYALTEEEAAAKAKDMTQALVGQLRGELEAAMKASGPVAAIEVCQQRAPVIAQEVSKQFSATIYRTSLKHRSVMPNAQEVAMLEAFNERQAKGEDVMQMAAKQVIDTPEGKQLHFMKALGTAPVCLTCHGTEIKPDVQAKLNALYPNDKATGYQAGQVRGAVSVYVPLQ